MGCSASPFEGATKQPTSVLEQILGAGREHFPDFHVLDNHRVFLSVRAGGSGCCTTSAACTGAVPHRSFKVGSSVLVATGVGRGCPLRRQVQWVVCKGAFESRRNRTDPLPCRGCNAALHRRTHQVWLEGVQIGAPCCAPDGIALRRAAAWVRTLL